jgi:signal transduction histidine kinase/integral membrane sensor domain MASE1/CheY-like chemotaxis protein
MNLSSNENTRGQTSLSANRNKVASEHLQHGSRLRQISILAAVALVYFAAAKVGLSLAIIHANVSPVWPPTGVAIAAVLLLGYWIWPAILIGAFAANLLTNTPFATDWAIAVGNTLEAVCAAALLERFGFHKALDRANDVFKFVFASLLCAMISATLGSFSLCLGHAANWGDFGLLWSTWWLGDTVGALVVAPVFLVWYAPLPKRRRLEATFVVIMSSLSALATFGGPNPISLRYYPLARLMIPFFLWAAFRLGTRGVTLSSLLLSIIAVWGTSNDLGPFAGRTPNDSLLVLQVFLGTNAVMFLFLVATVEERSHAFRNLSTSQRQMATSLEITRILSESSDLPAATSRILQTICSSLGWEVGAMWVPDAEGKALRCIAFWSAPSSVVDQFESITRELPMEPGVGLPGRVWTNPKPVWIPDVTKDENFPRAPIAIKHGLHAAIAFPIISRHRLLGVMEFFSHQIRQPDQDMLARFGGIGSQIGQFVERRRAEEERERLLNLEYAARAEAEIANRAKDEFLAVVSHELRTPLNAIVGWSSMLRRGQLTDEKVNQAIEIIDRNAKAQTQLIEDILDVSRIISGKFQLEPRPVQLPQVIDAAVESIRPAAVAKKIRINTTVGSNIGPVAGDAVRLQQVVWNLVSNAVKFSSVGGEIDVDVSGDNDDVQILVTDTGEGIPAEFLPLVFERFRQVDSSNSRRHGGLGLGLAIARHLVELHGGTVQAHSDGAGKGSVFTVKLPCMGVPQVILGPTASKVTNGRALAKKQLTDMRILSVEDDIDARTMLDTVLRDQGADVVSVSSVSEALEILSDKDSLPRVVISDLGMPVSDGYDLIRELRSRTTESGGQIPAIAISGYAANHDIQRALNAGFQMHLKKPVNWEELIAAVARFGRRA